LYPAQFDALVHEVSAIAEAIGRSIQPLRTAQQRAVAAAR
jgi:hypothetical protein